MSEELEQNDVTEALIDKVRTYMNLIEVDLSLTAPIKTSGIDINSGGYRTFALRGDEAFVFKGVREGKRKKLIFEFEPVDARKYSQIEFGEDALLSVFPQIMPHLVRSLDADPDSMSFSDAVKKFRKTWTKQERTKKREIEKRAKDEITGHYAGDPEWGAW